MGFDRDTLLATVRASPEAVAAHQRTRWLALFAPDAEINDPEGSRPHRGREPIERFYDTFIAPNDIVFEPDHDVVCGQTVVRDLVIATTLPSGLEVKVATHIRYHVVELDGEPRIHRLHAHWELLPMVLATLATGWRGFSSYCGLSLHMLKQQGIGGVLGFMRGFAGVGKAEKQHAVAALQAIADGDHEALGALLNGARPLRSTAASAPDLAACVTRLHGLRWRKLTAAGHWISATIETEDERGVAMFDFDAPGGPVLWLYLND